MYVPDQYAERSCYELFGFERVYEGDEFPGFLAIQHGKRSSGCSERRRSNRRIQKAFGGSSSSIRLIKSTRSSRSVAATALSMRSLPSRAASGFFAVWSPSVPQQA
jgi:hypothetical protein